VAKSKKNIKKRMMGLYIVFLVCMVILLGVTAYWQFIRGSWLKEEAEKQQTRDSLVTAKRGVIYDRNMKVIAQSASAYMVCVVPVEINKEEGNAEMVSKALSEILDIDYEAVYEKTQRDSYYEIVAKKVEQSDVDKIKALELPGVRFDEDTKRYYPNGNFASHVIGFTGDDNQGLDGIEAILNEELSGISGRIRTAKNAAGTDMPYEHEEYVDPVDGGDVVLTIDEVIQHFTEKHLEDARINNSILEGASAIVMNPQTGEILAMTTKPDFDLNQPFLIEDEEILSIIAELEGDEKTKAVNEALQKKWRNKATVDTYEPGSTFKAMVAAAAIEENVIGPNDTFTCTGSKTVSGVPIRCHKVTGHGTQTFEEAVKNSCNPALMEIGAKLGKENFIKYFKAFGFMEKTGLELGESVGIFHNPKSFTELNLATSSFGQSFTVTPLQMINAMCAIANGGNLMKPHLVKEVIGQDGSIITTVEPEIIRQVISKDTSDKMRTILESVVSDGGGKNAYVKGYRVAGKTGTSEKLPRGSGTYIASFLGFAPADNPQIAVIVMLDNPGGDEYYGGMIAAPVVGRIMEDTLRYLGVEPQYTAEELESNETAIPEVVGMSLSEAQGTLANNGFKYLVVGEGDKVISQMPKAGTRLGANAICILYTAEGSDGQTAVVPDVTQMSAYDCNYTLTNAGLNFKVTGPGKNIQNGAAMAIKQEPAPGTELPLGSVVSVEFRSVSIE